MHTLEIEKLVIVRLMTWQYFDKSRTARPNTNFTPPLTGTWIRPTVLGGINFMSGMSDMPCTREVGTVIVQLFDRENTGTGNLKTYADSLASHLSYHKADKLELLTASVIDIGIDGRQFYQYNVSIPYRYN